MYRIKISDSFDAAHFLMDTGTKCDDLHGHRWNVKVTLCSDKLSSKGWVIDFKIAKRWLQQITRILDHKVLNYYLDQPTAENLCYDIFKFFHRKVLSYNNPKNGHKENKQIQNMNVQVEEVEISETPGNTALYSCSGLTTKDIRKIALEKAGVAEKSSIRMKLNNPMKNRKYVEKMITSLRKSQKLSPNKEEQQVIKFMKENTFPFLFTGDGSFIIDGKIPDFVNKGKRIVVEYNQRFWHSDNNPWYGVKDDSVERRRFFEERGYKFYIIWSDEFEKDKKKIKADLKQLLCE